MMKTPPQDNTPPKLTWQTADKNTKLGATVIIWTTSAAIILGIASLLSLKPAPVSAARQLKYDECRHEKRQLGVSLIKADEICSWWKYNWEP